MKITYYGQAGFGMRLNGKDLLFDPFITPNKLASDTLKIADFADKGKELILLEVGETSEV